MAESLAGRERNKGDRNITFFIHFISHLGIVIGQSRSWCMSNLCVAERVRRLTKIRVSSLYYQLEETNTCKDTKGEGKVNASMEVSATKQLYFYTTKVCIQESY